MNYFLLLRRFLQPTSSTRPNHQVFRATRNKAPRSLYHFETQKNPLTADESGRGTRTYTSCELSYGSHSEVAVARPECYFEEFNQITCFSPG